MCNTDNITKLRGNDELFTEWCWKNELSVLRKSRSLAHTTCKNQFHMN